MGQPLTRQERNRRILTLAIFGAAGALILAPVARDALTPRPQAPPDWTLEELMMADRPGFDHRRAAAFQRAIQQAGGRCDAVEKALMQRPGLWVARCSPGYSFRHQKQLNL
jgi:hypothetical protein